MATRRCRIGAGASWRTQGRDRRWNRHLARCGVKASAEQRLRAHNRRLRKTNQNRGSVDRRNEHFSHEGRRTPQLTQGGDLQGQAGIGRARGAQERDESRDKSFHEISACIVDGRAAVRQGRYGVLAERGRSRGAEARRSMSWKHGSWSRAAKERRSRPFAVTGPGVLDSVDSPAGSSPRSTAATRSSGFDGHARSSPRSEKGSWPGTGPHRCATLAVIAAW